MNTPAIQWNDEAQKTYEAVPYETSPCHTMRANENPEYTRNSMAPRAYVYPAQKHSNARNGTDTARHSTRRHSTARHGTAQHGTVSASHKTACHSEHTAGARTDATRTTNHVQATHAREAKRARLRTATRAFLRIATRTHSELADHNEHKQHQATSATMYLRRPAQQGLHNHATFNDNNRHTET